MGAGQAEGKGVVKLVARVSLYEPDPGWWLRPAYHDLCRSHVVWHLFGVHWLVRLGRRIWEWTYICDPSRLEIKELEAYERGRRDGRRESRN